MKKQYQKPFVKDVVTLTRHALLLQGSYTVKGYDRWNNDTYGGDEE